jgi:type II secretory pathway pseudopilin PulG
MAILVAIIAPNLTKYLGSSKKETDKKNLDEVVAQVKNCISDASIQDIKITNSGNVATYEFVKSGATYSVTMSNGVTSFGQLVADALDGASTTSKVNTSSDGILVTVKLKSNGGYEVKAQFN